MPGHCYSHTCEYIHVHMYVCIHLHVVMPPEDNPYTHHGNLTVCDHVWINSLALYIVFLYTVYTHIVYMYSVYLHMSV